MLGLEAGAVDYVIKPFRLAELLARIASHLRMRDALVYTPTRFAAANQAIDLGDLTVDVAARRVILAGDRDRLASEGVRRDQRARRSGRSRGHPGAIDRRRVGRELVGIHQDARRPHQLDPSQARRASRARRAGSRRSAVSATASRRSGRAREAAHPGGGAAHHHAGRRRLLRAGGAGDPQRAAAWRPARAAARGLDRRQPAGHLQVDDGAELQAILDAHHPLALYSVDGRLLVGNGPPIARPDRRAGSRRQLRRGLRRRRPRRRRAGERHRRPPAARRADRGARRREPDPLPTVAGAAGGRRAARSSPSPPVSGVLGRRHASTDRSKSSPQWAASRPPSDVPPPEPTGIEEIDSLRTALVDDRRQDRRTARTRALVLVAGIAPTAHASRRHARGGRDRDRRLRGPTRRSCCTRASANSTGSSRRSASLLALARQTNRELVE